MTKKQLLIQVSKALQFYADPATYKSPSQGFAAQYDPDLSPIQIDKGKFAREVIEAATLEVNKVKKVTL